MAEHDRQSDSTRKSTDTDVSQLSPPTAVGSPQQAGARLGWLSRALRAIEKKLEHARKLHERHSDPTFHPTTNATKQTMKSALDGLTEVATDGGYPQAEEVYTRPIEPYKSGAKTNSTPVLRLRPPRRMEISTREAPYLLRGRNLEFNRIAGIISRVPKPLSVIEGSRGTGKTTLLEAVRGYAMHQGFAIIELHSEDLSTADGFAHKAEEALQDENGVPIPQHPSGTTAVEVTAQVPMIGSGSASRTHEQREIETYAWLTRRNIQKLVQWAQYSGYRGIIFTVDEMQHWQDRFDNDKQSCTEVRGILTCLNDEIIARKNRLPVTMILAGNIGVTQLAGSMTSKRLVSNQIVKLTEVCDEIAMDVIRDQLNIITEGGKVLPDVPEEWLREAAALCNGHMQHIAAVANAWQQCVYDASDAGTIPLDPQIHQEMSQLALQAVTDCYEERYDQIPTELQIVATKVAHATIACDNRISILNQGMIVNDLARELGTAPTQLARQLATLNILVARSPRVGQLHIDKERTKAGPGAPEAFFTVPVPSFATYIDQQAMGTSWAAVVTDWWQNIHPTLNPNPVAEWLPAENPILDKFEQLLPFTTERRGLVLELPCDAEHRRLTQTEADAWCIESTKQSELSN